MLLSKSHTINVTSRNITVWRKIYPDVVRGEIEVSSEDILVSRSSRIKLYFMCDRCGVEYSRTSCKVFLDERRSCLCESCIRSDSMNAYFSTSDGIASAKIRGENLKNNPKYLESRKSVSEKYLRWLYGTDEGKSHILMLSERFRSMTKFGPDNPNWNPRKVEYREYTRMCRKYTYRNRKIYSKWENYSLIGKSGVDGAYQLDHIIPIKYGFDNGYCPSSIGHVSNLQIIPWEENRSKSDNYRI